MFFFSGDTSSERLALDIKNWTVMEHRYKSLSNFSDFLLYVTQCNCLAKLEILEVWWIHASEQLHIFLRKFYFTPPPPPPKKKSLLQSQINSTYPTKYLVTHTDLRHDFCRNGIAMSMAEHIQKKSVLCGMLHTPIYQKLKSAHTTQRMSFARLNDTIIN